MKFSFVAQNIYPLISNECDSQRIGGAELQQLFIGKGLSSNGIDIQYITQDYGQQDGIYIDSMKMFKTFKEEAGLPVFRFIYPRLFKIWAALKKADSDIYYVRSAGFILGVVAFFCKQYGRKLIYAGAHDTDFIPGEHIIRLKRDVLLYQYGLKNCQKIIAQSKRQKNLLSENYQLESEVIRNLSLEPIAKLDDEDQKYILWVATIRSWKRPEYFIELSKQFPDEKFIMIGGEDFHEKELFSKITEACGRSNNIHFLGFKPLLETETYFNRCKVFVNTSTREGFPNTFLQAWRRGIPVLSFVDPDNLITDNNLGRVVSEKKQMSGNLKSMLLKDKKQAQSIRKYFSKNHSSGQIVRYIQIIKEMTS